MAMYLCIVRSKATPSSQAGPNSRGQEIPNTNADGSRPLHVPSLCLTHLRRIGAARVLVRA